MNFQRNKEFIPPNGTFERYPNMEGFDGGATADPQVERSAGLLIHRQSIRQKYEAEIERFEKEIAKRKEMLQLLADNPAIERFIDLQRS